MTDEKKTNKNIVLEVTKGDKIAPTELEALAKLLSSWIVREIEARLRQKYAKESNENAKQD